MSSEDVVVGEEPEYEEKLDEQPKSILLGLMRQLTTGMDLSRVTLPTFILEPRSFLEKCSDFMAHGSMLLNLHTTQDPMERMLMVTKWYMSGWYFKPPGVKKPYNPILGEVFRCRWEHGEIGNTYYVAEQVSHHPPISAFHFANRKANWTMTAVIKPKSKFLGNSAASIMEGEGTLVLHTTGEEYKMTFPSYYVRGLLIGVMRMEISGDVSIVCQKTNLEMKATFKNRGYFQGQNNSVEARISQIGSKDTLYKITGRWDKQLMVNDKKNKKDSVFLDVAAEKTQSFTPMGIEPEDRQLHYESRKVWSNVTKGLRSQNTDTATVHKQKLEDGQRAGKKEREEKGIEWEPKLFENMVPGDSKSAAWRFKYHKTGPYVAGDPEEEVFDMQMRTLHQTVNCELAVGQELLAEIKA